jgi:hypothetical protein
MPNTSISGASRDYGVSIKGYFNYKNNVNRYVVILGNQMLPMTASSTKTTTTARKNRKAR